MKCPNCGEENEYDPRLSNLGNLCWSCDTPITMFSWIAGLKRLEEVLKKDVGNARVIVGDCTLYYLGGEWIVRKVEPYHRTPTTIYAGESLELAAEKLDEVYQEREEGEN